MNTATIVVQGWIAVFGVAAIWLANEKRDGLRRWAPVAGLIAQPAWFYSSFTAAQWGIVALSFLYSAAWARGFYLQWMKA